MKIYENQRVADYFINKIAGKREERTGTLHASEVLQCLRKTYLGRTQPREHSRDSLMKFIVGFAVQEYILGEEKDGEEILIDGVPVIFSADRLVKNQVIEFKTTRRPYESLPKDPATGKGIRGAEKIKFDMTDQQSWLDRTAAYCVAHDVTKAHVLVYFLYGDLFVAWTIEFTDEDLDQARNAVKFRAREGYGYLERDEMPPVTTRLYDWECDYCLFKDLCKDDLFQEGLYA